MGKEIERKFLISQSDVPENHEDYRSAVIVQDYLAIAEDGTEVRIRCKGEGNYGQRNKKFTIGVKHGKGEERPENEVALDDIQYAILKRLTVGDTITKTRFFLPTLTYVIELDFYDHPHVGLIVAEVEFDTKEKAREFDPPNWFGREVTNDHRYKNQSLALNGVPDRDSK